MRIEGIGLLRANIYQLLSIYDKRIVLKSNEELTALDDVSLGTFDDEFKKLSSKRQLNEVIKYHTSKHFINRALSAGIGRVMFSSSDGVDVAINDDSHKEVVDKLGKVYLKNRKKALDESLGAISHYSITYGTTESSFGLSEDQTSLDFVLASDLVDGDEELFDAEIEFFQYAIDKIFGRSVVRLPRVVEADGNGDAKFTECGIEDGFVAERGIIGRTKRIDVHPDLIGIAYYVITNHNNKYNIIKKEVKEYKKIRDN